VGGNNPVIAFPDATGPRVIKVRTVYKGQEHIYSSRAETMLVGRSNRDQTVEVDLTEDRAVSHNHARIWFENGNYWIEDLNSLGGTQVNGVDIKSKGNQRLVAGDRILLGETYLELVPGDSQVALNVAPPIVDRLTESHEEIARSLGVEMQEFSASETVISELQRRLALFYDLPLRLGQEKHLDSLLQTIVDRLVQTIPGASRGALLVRDPKSGELLLKAHIPSGEPAISMTLAHRAMEEREGFLWRRGESDVTSSISENEIASGMYAPLLWEGQALGVICVDQCQACVPFARDDLRLLLALAQHASMSLANYQLQDEMRCNNALLTRLLTNFSPAVRDRLLEKARHGRLKLGGEKSEVAILFSDIRGFARISASMEADEVVDMLNEYLSTLVDPIFKNDGTIDKFVGDAILAVFGSPEPDPRHYEKAVRTAIGMQDAVKELNKKRVDRGETICEIGVGVHCGEVLHGFIGSSDRMEYTVIGDAVNRASRYCSAAGPGEVLISSEMHQRVWGLVRSRRTAIQTKHEGEWVAFRLEGLRELRQA
jgi:adenylate cyclase